MNIPQIKEWCNGLSLYQVKSETGYGKYYYVLATSFDEAAEKVIEYTTPKPVETTNVTDTGVGMGGVDVSPLKSTVKMVEKIKGVEILSELVII